MFGTYRDLISSLEKRRAKIYDLYGSEIRENEKKICTVFGKIKTQYT